MSILVLKEVSEAYMQACKERDKRSMELYRLRNPSVATQQKSSLLFTTLVQAFGEREGKREWMKYVHALRADKKRLKDEHRAYKHKAQTYLRFLNQLRTDIRIYNYGE